MKHETHFRPLEREHSLLSLVVEGKKDLVIDMDKIAELTDGDSAEEIADDIYDAEIAANQSTYKNYIEVHKPEMVDGKWMIKKTLTENGKAVYDSLQVGVFWDNRINGKDFKSSIQYYEDMIERGSIDLRFVDLIVNNQDPEFKALKGKLVYFKMQGQKQDNRITNL